MPPFRGSGLLLAMTLAVETDMSCGWRYLGKCFAALPEVAEECAMK